jgi:pimeloyl-ACP methyl ester carboxylesterase
VVLSRGYRRLRRQPSGPADRDQPATGTPHVVAVPGLGLSVAVARRAPQRLALPWSVVRLPAFGLRARRGTDLCPERLADRLLCGLPTDGPVVLVGHSASCQIVAEAARRAPGRVAALVLIGPTTDPRGRSWPALVRRWLRTALHERPGQIPLLVWAYARTGLMSMARGMDTARHHRMDRALAAVTCPVLIVRGRNDAICPADWAAALAEAAPRGRADTLPAGAHMVPITHPDALAARTAAFLDERVLER